MPGIDGEDASKVELALAGDREAFGFLAEKYGNALIATAFAVIENREIARDIAQDALIEAYLKLGSLREAANFASWTRGIARHKALDWLKRRKVEQQANRNAANQADAHAANDDFDPGSSAANAEENRLVLSAVKDLPEVLREMVLLRYMGQLSREECAKFLDITPAAADKRLQRAIETLRGRLGKHG